MLSGRLSRSRRTPREWRPEEVPAGTSEGKPRSYTGQYLKDISGAVGAGGVRAGDEAGEGAGEGAEAGA